MRRRKPTSAGQSGSGNSSMPSPTSSVPIDDDATAYARAVIAGDIVAGNLVRLACKRHLDDLRNGDRRGLRFDVAAATYAVAFVEQFCRHSKGEWARRALMLAPWQKFVLGSVFGWKRADGTRRYRYVYEEIARKNGKSTMLAAVGLLALLCDDEPGAEVYAAATKRDQARIIFDEARRMVGTSRELSAEVRRFKLNLSVDETG